MSKVVKFPGYGIGSPDVYLPITSIIEFHQIDFNGNYGTHITLPDGRYIRVSAWPDEVKKALEQCDCHQPPEPPEAGG